MAEIRLADVRKQFGQVAALQAITLTVRNGELLALLGPSGCGKTTTLAILAGFLVPDGGEVWADDRLLSSPRGAVPPEHRRMSLVFQSYALWPHMTVFQNVAFGLVMGHVDRGDAGFFVDAPDLEPHLLAEVRVEVGERFVEEEGVGLDDERARERHPLLLPA